MQIVKAEPANAGCWIDGHWGHYAVAQLVNIAAGHGYRDPATDPPFAQPDIVEIALRKLASLGRGGGVTGPEITDDEEEQLLWTADDVEIWMNDNVAPDGFSFGWYSGVFFLWSEAQWQEDGD